MAKKRNLEKYLKQVNFDKQYNKLIKNHKDKKIIIYGAGQMFKLINTNYDLSKLNIIGICDQTFVDDGEEYYFEYKKLTIPEVREVNADIVLTGTLEYIGLIDHLKKYVLKGKKIEYRPIVYMPFWMYVKESLFGISKKDFI